MPVFAAISPRICKELHDPLIVPFRVRLPTASIKFVPLPDNTILPVYTPVFPVETNTRERKSDVVFEMSVISSFVRVIPLPISKHEYGAALPFNWVPLSVAPNALL